MVESHETVQLDAHTAGPAEGPLHVRVAAREIPRRHVRGANIEPANGENDLFHLQVRAVAWEALVSGMVPVQQVPAPRLLAFCVKPA